MNLKHSSATTSSFLLPVADAFLLSVESSTCICVCPVCYTHTWSSASMWVPMLRGIGLWPVCMDIAASFSVLFFFSYCPSFSLSFSKASPTWWWVNKVSPLTFSLFQSLIMKELCTCFFSELGFAWQTPLSLQGASQVICIFASVSHEPWLLVSLGRRCPGGGMKWFCGQQRGILPAAMQPTNFLLPFLCSRASFNDFHLLGKCRPQCWSLFLRAQLLQNIC